jgi:hypothetical protein
MWVRLLGLEPRTSDLSDLRSNQLSYSRVERKRRESWSFVASDRADTSVTYNREGRTRENTQVKRIVSKIQNKRKTPLG